MNAVGGRLLREELAGSPQNSLSEDRAVRIAAGVLRCLEDVHQQGYVRGDISPSVIQLDASGGVRLSAPTTPDWNYCSPEEASGTAIDFRSDVFSVGAVLYEMLTGVKPFAGSSNEDIQYAIVNFEPSRQLQISGGVWTVLTKALSKIPADRYQTAKEFEDAINAVSPQSQAVVQPAFYPPAEPEPLRGAPPVRESKPSPRAAAQPPTLQDVFSSRYVGGAQSAMQNRSGVDDIVRSIPRTPPRTPLYEEEPKPKGFPAVAFLLVIAIIIFVAGVSGSSSSSSSNETAPVEIEIPKPQKQLPVTFTNKAELNTGSTVMMPTKPFPMALQLGSYKADAHVSRVAGGAYFAGELVGVEPAKDIASLQSYATQIAKSQANSQVGVASIWTKDKFVGGESRFRIEMGPRVIEGRVVVFNVRGHILFFMCRWPSDSAKRLGSEKFFGTIKL